MSVAEVLNGTYLVAVPELDGATFLYGTVICDELNQFGKGHWLLSSMVIAVSGDIVQTKNHQYRVENTPENITVSKGAFGFISKGVDPLAAIKMCQSFKSSSELTEDI